MRDLNICLPRCERFYDSRICVSLRMSVGAQIMHHLVHDPYSHARRAQKIKNLLVHALILHQTHIRDEALTFSSSTKLTSTLQSDKNKKGQGYWVMYMYTVYSFPHNLKFRTCSSVAISLFFPFIIFTFALLCLNFRHLWYKFCHVFPVHFMIFSNTVIYSSLLDLIVIINLISSSNMFKHYSLMLLHVKISCPKY